MLVGCPGNPFILIVKACSAVPNCPSAENHLFATTLNDKLAFLFCCALSPVRVTSFISDASLIKLNPFVNNKRLLFKTQFASTSFVPVISPTVPFSPNVTVLISSVLATVCASSLNPFRTTLFLVIYCRVICICWISCIITI